MADLAEDLRNSLPVNLQERRRPPLAEKIGAAVGRVLGRQE